MSRRDAGPAGRAGKILVVEDSPSARRLLQDILLRLGSDLENLRLASSPVEARELFTRWRPNLVFLDLQLGSAGPDAAPGGSGAASASPESAQDGVELAVLFRKQDPEVRIIICTASDPDNARVSRMVRGGEVDFIVKPILAARIEDILSRRPVEPSRRGP
ncbi:MAG: response regulator [Thermoplasmata archaeon]